jgi:hypothetical protein
MVSDTLPAPQDGAETTELLKPFNIHDGLLQNSEPSVQNVMNIEHFDNVCTNDSLIAIAQNDITCINGVCYLKVSNMCNSV